MIRSMTGFSSAQVETPRGPLTIEMRSVNSRFLDMQIRLPDELKALETGMRELLGVSLVRGKVEFRATFGQSEKQEMPSLNSEQLTHLKNLLSTIRSSIPEASPPTAFEILQWPGVLNQPEIAIEGLKNAFFVGTKNALQGLIEARQREGERLSADISQKTSAMLEIITQLELLIPKVNLEFQSRVSNKLHDLFRQAFPNGLQRISGAELSERILQESNLFSMRVDVSEELSRLRSHLTEVSALLGQDKPAGRKLDFLTQELHREANTLGAKSPNIELTRGSIELKLLTEQIREQVQNIE